MRGSFCQASGMSIIMASGSSCPERTSSSSTVSKLPESDCHSGTMGSSFSSTSWGRPSEVHLRMPCRDFIQFLFPRSVLISPVGTQQAVKS